MADLTTEPSETSSCCAAEAQATCCDPSEKAACCEQSAAGLSCGCSAGQAAEADIRETVRARYAEAALALTADEPASYGCSTLNSRDRRGSEVFGPVLYDDEQAEGATADVDPGVARLRRADRGRRPAATGETVLDLGSGAGADVLISARRVAPTGKAIGLDMTDEMLELARANAAEAGVENVEFVKGYIEDMPLGGRERRRGHLQLRDQPLRRQAQGHRRSRARAPPRGPVRGLRRDRRPRHGRADPRRHGRLDRLHRRRAHRGGIPGLAQPRRLRGHRDPTAPTRSTSTPPPRSSAPASL